VSRPDGIVLLGGGGHARVVLSVLRLIGERVVGYTDLRPRDAMPPHVPYLGDDEVLRSFDAERTELVSGIGSVGRTHLRTKVYLDARALGLRFTVVRHPSALVDPGARIGLGVQLMAGAIVQTGASLAENVLVNTGAIVDHDTVIEAHAHLAPGAVLSGGVSIGEGAHVGAGAVVRQGVRVGKGAIVGAGAVVVNDVADGSTVVGVPARPRTPRTERKERGSTHE